MLKTWVYIKALVTFISKEAMEEFLCYQQPLLEFFDEIRNWNPEEVCQTHRVWLECVGLPLHAWSLDNFGRMAKIRGTMFGIDITTKEGRGFKNARILIDSCFYPYIQSRVYFSVDSIGFDSFVRELCKGYSIKDFQLDMKNCQV